MKLWEFLEVFCHLHSKYQKQPHSVIYFLKDTVDGHLNLYNMYATLIIYLKNCKKLIYKMLYSMVLSHLYETIYINLYIDIHTLKAIWKGFQNISIII